LKILVIEDQDDLREVVVETLREESYATDSSADGEEGLYKALNWDYDLVILDVLMPGLNGWQVLEKLRKEKNTPVMTTFPSPLIFTSWWHVQKRS